MNKKRHCSLRYCLLTLLVTAALLLAARLNTGFAEWYARHIFPLFPYVLGRLFSPLPFSAFELLLIVAIAGLGVLLVYSLVMLARGLAARTKLRQRWRQIGPALGGLCCTLLLLYTLTCGMNDSRAPLAQALGLTPRLYSSQDLRQLYQLLNEQAQDLAGQINTDEAGYFSLPPLIGEAAAQGYGAKREALPPGQAREAMRNLGHTYRVFDVYYPYPKAVLFSEGLSYLQISGIYSPFTIEANYNCDMPASNIPFAICHELAHLSGYAREDEANFTAYLACLEDGDVNFRYSGLFNAIIYVLNALYGEVGPAEYRELYNELPLQVRRDLQQNSNYWQSFAGRVAKISEDVNDFYLKANNQPEGVKSYGRMVDLLLAYYLDPAKTS